ncbi:nucleotidyltransferase family protein [Pseudonocardia sp. GCM10023141]|uniref:nucleotidyltransferase family protein n=1 Tax=Pseudonocardia sp. GCM10023141 TaxID=3252653 RepID=UPI00362376BA
MEECYADHLLGLAAFGLPGSTRPLPAGPLGEQEWAALLPAVIKHRLSGQLQSAIRAGAFPATPQQREQATGLHRTAAIRAMVVEGELVATLAKLSGHGIPTRVLKGSAVAHLDYAQTAVRSFNDLDLLLRPGDFDEAVRVLVGSGLVRTLAEPRPGFDQRFDKGTTLRSPAGLELDLHRTFVLGPWGVLVDMGTLWETGEEFAVSGGVAVALSRPNRFLHACYHAALGDWPLRLGSLRDIAEMLPAVERDASAVRRRAASWGVEAIAAAAIADTLRLLGLEAGSTLRAWAVERVPNRREETWLGLHTRENKTFAAQALATIRALPGLRDKAAYVRALLLPDQVYTSGRHASVLERWRYGVREIRRGRSAAR